MEKKLSSYPANLVRAVSLALTVHAQFSVRLDVGYIVHTDANLN